MIIGIGTDLVELERIRNIGAGKTRERFLQRILTPEERGLIDGYSNERVAEFVAGRFAAKEAIVKAIGCGIGEKAGFQDISIVPNESGKPICHLSARTLEQLKLEANTMVHITITHTSQHALAFAVVEA